MATATARLEEAWMKYEEGQQDVLGLAAEDQVEDELAIFFKIEEICETNIDKASKISRKGKGTRKEKKKTDNKDEGGEKFGTRPDDLTPDKETRREQFSQAGPSEALTANKAIYEEAVKRYLEKRPMTTADLRKRFMLKGTDPQNDHLSQTLATVLKRINPHKHEVKGKIYLSLKNERRLTKDVPDQDKLLKEAGARLEEMVLVEDVSHPLSEKPAGSEDRTELCGWWGEGEPASAACLYSSHELKGAGSKDKTYGCKPLVRKARITPLFKIEEGLPQPTPRSKEIKEARKADTPAEVDAPAESAAPVGEVEAVPSAPSEKEEGDDLEGICKLVKEAC